MNKRELDALVAEKVMGLEVKWIHDVTFIEDYPVFKRKKGLGYAVVEFYSDDIAAAWRVRSRVGELDPIVWLSFTVNIDKLVGSFGCKGLIQFPSEDAATIICLAALRACGVDVSEFEKELVYEYERKDALPRVRNS